MSELNEGLEIFENYRSSVYRLEDAISSLTPNPAWVVQCTEDFAIATRVLFDYIQTKEIKAGHPEFLYYAETLRDCTPKIQKIEVKFLIKKAILPKAYFSSKKP